MAWPWNKDESAAKTEPEQTKSEVDQLVEKLTAHFDTKFAPVFNDVTALKADFDALKTAAASPPPKESSTEPRQLTSFIDDGDRAFAERIGPLAVQTTQLSARVIEGEALRQVQADGWDTLIPEIRKHLDNTPLQRKAANDYGAYVENVVSMVIGANARKAGLRMDGSKKTFYLEDASAKTAVSPHAFSPDFDWVDSKGRVHKPEETLSKLGIDPAKFAKEHA